MDDHDKIIVAIVFGVIGIISIIVIICFIIWLIRRNKLKSIKLKKSFSISHRQQFQPSQKLTSIKSNNNQRKTKRKRFNTNDSVISLSFNPPHLINQNVKNLDSLRPTDRSWPYGNSVQTASNKDYR
jgi:FtsZ-interacting cell division protein ZipA